MVGKFQGRLRGDVNQHHKTNRQFLELCGTWQNDKSADKIIKQVRSARFRGEHRLFKQKGISVDDFDS